MPTLSELMAQLQLKNDSPEYIGNILNNHADKNFVQRILKPDLYPNIDLGNGFWGTHLMASANYRGKDIVFPTIIQMPNGNLEQLDMRSAIEHAINNNEYIPFNSSDEANWFGKNYKSVWGQ